MKTQFDPRHQKRRKAVCDLFSFGFHNELKPEDELPKKVVKTLSKIDASITKAAPAWPLDQINRVDLAVLRLAVYELMIAQKEPVKVIIDEAVELAKEFGSESSPSFVNGVLGHILKEVESENEPEQT